MNKQCPICYQPIEKYSIVYFDENNIFYHMSCIRNITKYMKGICWFSDVPEIHLFSYPLE